MKDILKKILINILQWEARLVLHKYKPKVITITGSVGKTSTKDAVYAALSALTYVRKSEKSYNSEIGLPLTVLGVPNGWNNPIVWLENIMKGLWLIIYPHKYPKWLVLEVGVGKPGDMKKTALWLGSDVVVITAIGETPVHIEFFNGKKHLMEEKSLLIKTLKKDGLLVLNADDEGVLGMKAKAKSRVITYGFSEGADVRAWGDSIFYNEEGLPEGINLRVDEKGGTSLPVFIEGVFGLNHVYASLAALAIFSGLKWNLINAIASLKNYEVPPGRMRLLRGINDSLIIDDTYNSSPFASESALKTVDDIKLMAGKRPSSSGNRKIVVLGDMLELGRHTVDSHKNIGSIVSEVADVLVVVGPRAQDIKGGAASAGMKEKNIFNFSTSSEAGEFLKSFVRKNDIVLLKGSQGVRMERAVAAILLDQENKEKLLVRQDKEWLDKA